MAAAARSPGPSDARVPCPQCGGLVHPIAGRCRHCKADLAASRPARAPAAAALPPLLHGSPSGPIAHAHPPAPAPPPAPTVSPWANPAGARAFEQANELAREHYAPRLVAPPPPVAPPSAPYDPLARAPAPILPPRPTAHGHGTSVEPAPSAWRHWPIAVIILAVVAIGIAIAIMFWPPKSEKHASGALGPAPERMDTNPLPEQMPHAADPWSNGNAPDPKPGPQPDPPPQALPNQPVPPHDDDNAAADPDTNTDPQIDPDRLFGSGGLALNGTGKFALEVFQHACKRLVTCGSTAGGADLAQMCSTLGSLHIPGTGATCPAAARCLSHIDQLDCNAHLDSMGLMRVMTQFSDCAEAARC